MRAREGARECQVVVRLVSDGLREIWEDARLVKVCFD